MSIPLRALLYRRTSEPSEITVDFDGEIFVVRVRRHAQARRYTLRIHAAMRDVVLTMLPVMLSGLLTFGTCAADLEVVFFSRIPTQGGRAR